MNLIEQFLAQALIHSSLPAVIFYLRLLTTQTGGVTGERGLSSPWVLFWLVWEGEWCV